MTVLSRVFLVALSIVLASCGAKQPPRKRTIAAPTLSCAEANRLAYRTVTVLGYTPASLQVATPGQPGHILARKEGAKDGKVTITCNENGAIVEPEKTGLPIPKLVGAAEAPGEFPQMFTQTFNVLRTSQEIAAKQGPEKGLTMTMTPLNGFESQMDFGADLPASGILPIKVVISNNTSRPYGLEVSTVYLQPAGGGGRVAPIAPPAAGQGKALQGDLLLQPGQVVTGYLFYPAGEYSSARTMLIDKETEEREGFSIQF
jgi:hypothetical protein